MTVLVIGGSGFVGEAAGRALREAGVDAVSASRRADYRGPFTRHVQLDRQDEDALLRALHEVRPDVLLDLACYQPFELEAALLHFTGTRYVFVSAQNVYPFEGMRPHEDDFIPLQGEVMDRVDNPLADGESYTRGKQWCETLLLRGEDPRWVSLRLPAVFGRHDHTTRITAYMQRIADGGPLLVPAETIDLGTVLAWVDDVGRACAAACDLARPLGRTAINIAYGDLTGRQFLTALARAMDHHVELVEAPIDHVPPVARPYGPHRELPGSITKRAGELLDFTPTPIEAALKDPVAWFFEEQPTSPFYTERETELALAKELAAVPG